MVILGWMQPALIPRLVVFAVKLRALTAILGYLCREQGYFDLEEISAAIFEHNGKLSILPRAASRPATPTDLGISVRATHIGVEVIMDGRIMGENLARAGRDENWLRKQIAQEGYKDEREILLGIYRPEEERLTLYPNA